MTVTNEGLNYLLNMAFHGTTLISDWYIGLISGSGFISVDVNDTMSSHPGWTECTTYTLPNRGLWEPKDYSLMCPTCTWREEEFPTVGSLEFNGASVIKGIFVTSENTKGGSTGLLLDVTELTSTLTFANGDYFQTWHWVRLE